MNEALIGMVTGISALVSVGIFIYNRGQREGALMSMVNELKGVVPQMLEVQKRLAAVCQQLSEHTCDLDRGSEKMETINREISDIRERLARVEAKIGLFSSGNKPQ